MAGTEEGGAPVGDVPVVPRSIVPVTLVTGFLGAGKTSLLNKLVNQLSGHKKIAVIENEFGEVNLDGELVSNQLRSKEDLVSISRGCVCCSLRKDIVKALAELQQRSKTVGAPYNNILLETTGLADPGPVAFTFFANKWVQQRFRLDCIVAVVDAVHLKRHLRSEEAFASSDAAVNETVNQIAYADIVLLNKIDLVSAEEVEEVEAAIRCINTIARVIHTRLDTDDCPQWLTRILDNNAFSLSRALEIDPQFLDTANSDSEASPPSPSVVEAEATADSHAAADCSADAASSPVPTSQLTGAKRAADDVAGAATMRELTDERALKPHKRARAIHDLNGVASIVVTLPGALDEYRFNMFMRDFLQECGTDVFRSKGSLCIHGRSKRYVFQGVHETFQISTRSDSSGAVDDKQQRSDLVFIGRNLDRDAIKQGLQTCMWRPLPSGWSEYTDAATKRVYYVQTATGLKQWVRPFEFPNASSEGMQEPQLASVRLVQPESQPPPDSQA